MSDHPPTDGSTRFHCPCGWGSNFIFDTRYRGDVLHCPECKQPLPDEQQQHGKVAESVQPERDEYTIMNLSMFVRRLARLLRKHEPESKAATQALDYLERQNLQGSILREQPSEPAPAPATEWVMS